MVRTEAPSTTADTFIQPTTRHNYIDPHDSSWKGGHEDQYFPPWSHGYQNSPETYGRNNGKNNCHNCISYYYLLFFYKSLINSLTSFYNNINTCIIPVPTK